MRQRVITIEARRRIETSGEIFWCGVRQVESPAHIHFGELTPCFCARSKQNSWRAACSPCTARPCEMSLLLKKDPGAGSDRNHERQENKGSVEEAECERS